jgi:hypothetical protein
MPSDPCRVVLVKDKVIKGICLGSGVMLTPPFAEATWASY